VTREGRRPVTVLEFVEQGQTVGSVELRGDDLVGPLPLVEIVQSRTQVFRIRRPGLTTAEAFRGLDGWSNGYLSARLTGE
jgi:hypothetical protein